MFSKMQIILTAIVTTLLPLWSFLSASELNEVFSEGFLDYINARQNLWTAGKNWMPTKYVRISKDSGRPRSVKNVTGPQYNHSLPLPSHFDARKRWPQCPSIAVVPDQGLCQAAWAVAAAATMTDRLCIATNNSTFKFSSEDIITCCHNCSDVGNGCLGGDVRKAWDFWMREGVVSGSGFGEYWGCKPYSVYLSYYMKITEGTRRQPPLCIKTCTLNKYPIIYMKDKKKGGDFHMIRSAYVPEIQEEIIMNGPVQTEMMLYVDFFTYKSGVYFHQTDIEMGWHSVSLIGWGEENNVSYWLVRNTWGDGWGNFSGLFKILRGVNEAYIEENIYVGLIKNSSEEVSSSAIKTYPLTISICISFVFCSVIKNKYCNNF